MYVCIFEMKMQKNIFILLCMRRISAFGYIAGGFGALRFEQAHRRYIRVTDSREERKLYHRNRVNVIPCHRR